jgi:hypothetical protein
MGAKMYQDFKEFLAAFNEYKVKYLIIGGYAVGFHAEPRATKDLDILIGRDPENAKAAYAALKSFGAPMRGIKAADLIEKDAFFRVGSPPLMIDILSAASGVNFEAAWSRREPMTIDKKTKLKAWVISCKDLIASKIAAGRAQDLIDVAALRAAAGVLTKRGANKKRDLKL